MSDFKDSFSFKIGINQRLVSTSEYAGKRSDGEYVRFSEEAGKHESGDNHGHSLL